MKRIAILVLLVSLSYTGFSQKSEKDSLAATPAITDSTLLLNVKDMDNFLDKTGKLLGDYLTKTQWDMVRAAMVQEASATVQQAVLRYSQKAVPKKGAKN